MQITRRYELPQFLSGAVAQDKYERWIRPKAQTHVRRDRRRGNHGAMGETYLTAIHRAVIESMRKDAYAGETLDWELSSSYDNDESRNAGREYKRKLALLPTVDRVGDGLGQAAVKICSWRTNGAKHDLELAEFVVLCRALLEHHGSVVTGGG